MPVFVAVELRINPRHDFARRQRPEARSHETSANLAHDAALTWPGRNSDHAGSTRERERRIFSSQIVSPRMPKSTNGVERPLGLYPFDGGRIGFFSS